MNFDLVLDHVTSIKKDANYISTILNDNLPPTTNTGRMSFSLPTFSLEQNERDQIIEISESILTRISEINKELDHHSWKQHIQGTINFGQQLYATALGINNEPSPDDAALFEPLGNLITSINGLGITIKVENAMNKGSSEKKYSENQLNANLNELEKKKRETRLKVFNKLDTDLKKLLKNLEHQNSNVLDKTVDKILYLSGFDTEIYDPVIPGNIDVIAIDTRNEIVCICENTTGQLAKKKVDQIVGRKTEYEGDYKSWKNVKVHLVLSSTTNDVFVDDLARRECVLNGVSVLNKKDLEDLIKNVKKGKMSPTLFVEYIKKKVPI